jgi:hypothetical protein
MKRMVRITVLLLVGLGSGCILELLGCRRAQEVRRDRDLGDNGKPEGALSFRQHDELGDSQATARSTRSHSRSSTRCSPPEQAKSNGQQRGARPFCNLLSLVAVVALHRVDIGLYGLFLLLDHRARLLTGSHLVAGDLSFLLLDLRGSSMNIFAYRVLDVLDGIL